MAWRCEPRLARGYALCGSAHPWLQDTEFPVFTFFPLRTRRGPVQTCPDGRLFVKAPVRVGARGNLRGGPPK